MEKIIEKIFKYAKKTPCEVIIFKSDSSLTRFADNEISQNVSSDVTEASIRLLDAGKTFKFSINQFDEQTIAAAFNNAFFALKFLKKEDVLPLLKTSVKINYSANFYASVPLLGPRWRAEKVKKITSFCQRKKMISYGIVSNGVNEIIVANNNGVFQRSKESFLDYEVTVKDKDGYGVAFASSNDENVNFDEKNAIAVDKASRSKNPVAIKPGKYTVILEPQPADELLSFLGYYGFAGQNYAEKTSFVSESLNKKLFPSNVNILDNALDGKCASMPFDFEGSPKEKVELVKGGVIKGIVTDRKVAKQTGFRNTGHALPQPSYYGPMPMALSMKEGDSSLEKMISGCENGILVTQFHYTNCLKPKNIEMTGMTRNGTFLVKNGRVGPGIKNMRFTQSAVEAFKNIEAIGDKGELFSGYFFSKSFCPALKIKDFNFSSGTEF